MTCSLSLKQLRALNVKDWTTLGRNLQHQKNGARVTDTERPLAGLPTRWSQMTPPFPTTTSELTNLEYEWSTSVSSVCAVCDPAHDCRL